MCRYKPAICQGCACHSFRSTFGSAVTCCGLETFSRTCGADLCRLIPAFFVFDFHEPVGRSRVNVTVMCVLTIHLLDDLKDPGFSRGRWTRNVIYPPDSCWCLGMWCHVLCGKAEMVLCLVHLVSFDSLAETGLMTLLPRWTNIRLIFLVFGFVFFCCTVSSFSHWGVRKC